MSLGRHISVIGFHTALGRFLGYVRDTLIIATLGASAITDAFFISTKIASLFRRLFSEGAFNASFIPIFTSLKEKKGDQKAVSFAEQSMVWMLAIVGIVTLYVLLFTESFVGLIAAGFQDDPEKLQWTIEFTKIVFPYILLICLTAVVGAVLNAVENYIQTAASQTVGNISIIALFFAFQPITPTKAHAAAWAITVSALIQLIWLYITALKLGIVIRPRMPRLTSPIREFMRRLIPGIFGTGMVQINVLVSIYFGSYLGDGGVSYLQITERINQFPLSIIGVSLGTVLIPMLTAQIQQHSMKQALETQNKAIEVSLALALPTMAIAIAFAPIIVAALFMHGKFTASDVVATAPCLSAFISGLPAYVLLKVFSSTFFALKDTLRPSIAGIVAMVINALICYLVINQVILTDIPDHIGIALALSISGWVNTFILGLWAYVRGYVQITKGLIVNVLKTITITAILTIIGGYLVEFVQPYGFSEQFSVRAITLCLIAFVAIIGYVILDLIAKRMIKVNQ